MKKIALLILIAVAVVLFFISGLHRELTLEGLRAARAHYQGLAVERPLVTMAGFAALYIPVIAINLPGAVVLGLAAGALFGTVAGTVLVSFASTIGATLACLLSRYLMRDWVANMLGERMKRIDAGIREEGAFYLFSLRLIPVIPFFAINMAMGLTSMRLSTFFWVSQLGMLPGTALFINAGSHLGGIASLSGILSPGVLLSFALLGLFPLAARKGVQRYRRRSGRETLAVSTPKTQTAPTLAEPLAGMAEAIHDQCTHCGACLHSCRFLQEHGTPGALAAALSEKDFETADLAYGCSLCGLCGAVCPEKLDPCALFLELRRLTVARGRFEKRPYRSLLTYERVGMSSLFSWHGLPGGCDTVFFPGCTLSGTRPQATLSLFRHLQQRDPTLGIVLDCCAKPSHDLGRQSHFETVFGALRGFLQQQGVKTVLLACPNCQKVFRQYADGIEARSVYEVLGSAPLQSGDAGFPAQVVVHDACAVRDDSGLQRSVRRLLGEMNIPVCEMRHRGRRTLCCGEGGAVAALRPDLAHAWTERRTTEAGEHPMVTYCAGCTALLDKEGDAVHLVDLLFRSGRSNGRPRVARAPATYLNRLLLKRHLRKTLSPHVRGERNLKEANRETTQTARRHP
jgi:uncharacterized membrane protein YdjX (TVP38/TMEM64 family)/Fe-S oxidoreductase